MHNRKYSGHNCHNFILSEDTMNERIKMKGKEKCKNYYILPYLIRLKYSRGKLII